MEAAPVARLAWSSEGEVELRVSVPFVTPAGLVAKPPSKTLSMRSGPISALEPVAGSMRYRADWLLAEKL